MRDGKQQREIDNIDTNLPKIAAPGRDGSHARQPGSRPTERLPNRVHQGHEGLPLAVDREVLGDPEPAPGR